MTNPQKTAELLETWTSLKEKLLSLIKKQQVQIREYQEFLSQQQEVDQSSSKKTIEDIPFKDFIAEEESLEKTTAIESTLKRKNANLRKEINFLEEQNQQMENKLTFLWNLILEGKWDSLQQLVKEGSFRL